jgi:hypothetical protein
MARTTPTPWSEVTMINICVFLFPLFFFSQRWSLVDAHNQTTQKRHNTQPTQEASLTGITSCAIQHAKPSPNHDHRQRFLKI